MHILMMTSDSLPGQATVSIWTGLRFMSSDTAWVWNIPTYGNLSCTLGTRDTRALILNWPKMTSRVLGHYTVRVSVSVCLFGFSLFFMKDLRQKTILVNANLVSLLCIQKLRPCPHFECVFVVLENRIDRFASTLSFWCFFDCPQCPQ